MATTEEMWAYYQDGHSLTETGQRFGVSGSGVSKRFKKAGLQARDVYEPDRHARMLREAVEMFESGLSSADIGEKLGKSPKTIRTWIKEATGSSFNRRSRTVDECPCGKPAQSVLAKYCSKECRLKYTPRPQRTAWVTYTCETCGEEFEAPRSQGPRRFCSNKCAKTRGWFSGRKVTFDSRWEFRVAAWCEMTGTPWRFYDGPDLETPAGIYRPDFIIELEGEEWVVEVKGHRTEDSDEKIGWARANVERYMVMGPEMEVGRR